MKYQINGVFFTEQELSLLHTFKHMVADSNVKDTTELPSCNIGEPEHMHVIQELAAWFLEHPTPEEKEKREMWEEECIQVLEKSTRKHRVDSCSNLLILYVVFDYVNFQLLEIPLQRHLASCLPVDSKELLSLFKQEGEELKLDQKIANDIMELAHVLPHSNSLQCAKAFLTSFLSEQHV